MNTKLIESFKHNSAMTSDKNHAAACAIFDVIFCGDDKKWNAPQDAKWMAKYNRGLLILATAGLITLCAK